MPTYKKTKALFNFVVITTGDTNGIGLEVAAKSLLDRAVKSQISSSPKTKIVLFVDQNTIQTRYIRALEKSYSVEHLADLKSALAAVSFTHFKKNAKKPSLFLIHSTRSPADWVVETTRAALKHKNISLVTGPLSKKLIAQSGYSEIGHTGLFRSLTKNSDLYMAFVGDSFNVMLASDHIEHASVEKSLLEKNQKSIELASLQFKTLLKSKKPIAYLGLNPHSGEDGLLGSFEKKFRLKKHVGPLVPDAAFFKSNWKKFSHFVCLYHDQGLIPFKMIHGQDSGVHLTVGLPFVRTSVDHGTAFDIFNKNKANYSSMKQAILLTFKLIKGR